MSLPESKPIIAVANQKQEIAVPPPSPSLDELTDALIAFRDARDWKRFHSLKNLMISLNLEVSELLELTQWKDDEQVERAVDSDEFRARFAEECADIFIYLLLICERAGIDITAAAAAKIEKNAARYPVEKSRGNAKKYTEL